MAYLWLLSNKGWLITLCYNVIGQRLGFGYPVSLTLSLDGFPVIVIPPVVFNEYIYIYIYLDCNIIDIIWLLKLYWLVLDYWIIWNLYLIKMLIYDGLVSYL